METSPTEAQNPEDSQLLPVSEWLLDLNQRLAAAAASASEQAFGVGCAVSLAPIAIVLGLAFLFGVRHWVSLLLTGVILGLLAIAWAVFVALQAQRKAPQRAWQEQVRVEFEAGLAARHETRERLIAEAQTLLPEGAPLRRALDGEFEAEGHLNSGA